MKITKEYLSILQFLLYKAQKRKKLKILFKFQTIFYQSKSLIFFILRKKSFKNLELKKNKNSLSEKFFQKILNISFSKKELQNYSLWTLMLKKKTANFFETDGSLFFHSSSFLFFDYLEKQIFVLNFNLFFNNPATLVYLSFFNNFCNLIVPQILKEAFLHRIFYPSFLLLLKKNKVFFFDNFLKKKIFNVFFFSHYYYLEFYYTKFFSYHNFCFNKDKIQYLNIYFFDFLTKTNFGVSANQIQQKRFYKKNEFLKETFSKKNAKIVKKNFFYNYSILFYFPSYKSNFCSFAFSLNSVDRTKNSLEKLNIIQKQTLFFICEPIWEAFFELALYSNRRGRSLFDALAFLRFHLKKQPMFVYKASINFFNPFYKELEKYREDFLHNKFFCFFNKKKMRCDSLNFFSFFENLILYGLQKKYQNYYLIIKQQLFLYQLLKIFKQNKKNHIYFSHFFYNNHSLIFSIQSKIFNKLKKNLNNYKFLISSFKRKKLSIRFFTYFLLESRRYSIVTNYEYKISFFSYSSYFITLSKLKKYRIKNSLFDSLNKFFFQKTKTIKHKLFSLQLKKQSPSVFLQQIFLTFFSIKSKILKKTYFSLLLKDSSLFVSKNNFLFLKKQKKLFFEIIWFNQSTNKTWSFYRKIKKNNNLLLKEKNFKNSRNKINSIKKLKNVFVSLPKIHSGQWNYKNFLKINLFAFFGYSTKFVNLSIFHNNLLNICFLVKNKYFFNKKIFYQKIFVFYFKFYGTIFSFFKFCFQKIYIFYLLKSNDVNTILEGFINYENRIFYFSSNYLFLKSFKTILKKFLIVNKFFLVFNFKKDYYPTDKYQFTSQLFLCYYKNFLVTQLKIYFYLIALYIFKNDQKIKNKTLNEHFLSIWSMKFYKIKKRHSFLFYKKHLNGLYFFNFFISHTNKKNKKLFSNNIFFWEFYNIQILLKYKYISCLSNYYKILSFLSNNRKIFVIKYKQLLKLFRFYFVQSFFLKNNYFILWRFKKCIQTSIKYHICYQKKYSILFLSNLFFHELFENQFLSIIYRKLIQQKKLKIYYYFSIKPSKKYVQKHLIKIYNNVQKNYNKNQEYLIFRLSKIIKNWCLYYQFVTPTILFKYLDYLTFQILWKWACKRHSRKSHQWIKLKYFYNFDFIYTKSKNNRLIKGLKRRIFFASQLKDSLDRKETEKEILKQSYLLNNIKNNIFKKTFICLPNHSDIILIKHKFLQNDRSPFDLDLIYWLNRYD